MNLANLFDLDPDDTMRRVESLTVTERVVASMTAQGLRIGEIAHRLRIGSRTVDTHRNHVLGKLGTTTSGIGRLWYFYLLVRQNGDWK